MAHMSPAVHAMDVPAGSTAECHDAQEYAQYADHGDATSKASKAGCCVVACGQSILTAHEIDFSYAGWQLADLLPVVDDLVKGRSVSPMLRPPRLAA